MRGRDYAELVAFVTVARERSFRGGAAQIGLSPSVVSRTIRALEARIGARLLDRTTRSVTTTEAGRELLKRLDQAFSDVDSAIAAARDASGRPGGRLRLNLPRLAFQTVLEPRLGEFARVYPDIQLDLVIDDDLNDIVEAGFDAGVRMGGKVAGDMIALRLTEDVQPVVAGTPLYLASRPPPEASEDLRVHACLNYRWSGTGTTFRWRFLEAGREVEAMVSGPLLANDSDVLVSAALSGMGLVYLPELRLRPYLQDGSLVEVLPGRCAPIPGFFLYYADRRYERAALRALIDFFKL